jgi:Na+-transporting methylmalonyl-CoA/oxaloacetate decarboxylase gamma subunit
MNAETIQHAWEWLLNLSKVQLILLGGGVSLLVAVSKVMRFLFILAALVIFLTTLLPQAIKRYQESPLPMVIEQFVPQRSAPEQPPSETRE